MFVCGVLVLGKSLLFRSDSILFRINDRTLLEIACDIARSSFTKRYIILEADTNINIPDFVVVRDVMPGKGPLVGIYSALSIMEEIGCVFIPVDMPYLTVGFLRYIGSLGEAGYDVVFINYSGKIYPLPGYYSKNLCKTMEKMIQDGELSLKNLVFQADKKYQITDGEILRFGDPHRLLRNINTPQDISEDL